MRWQNNNNNIGREGKNKMGCRVWEEEKERNKGGEEETKNKGLNIL